MPDASHSSRPAPSEQPRPALRGNDETHTLLIGTQASLIYLRHLLPIVHPTPRVVTWAITPLDEGKYDRTQEFSDGLSVETSLLLDTIRRHEPIEQAWISLPLVMGQQTREIAHALDTQGIEWRFLPTLVDQLAGRLRPILGPLSDHNTLTPSGGFSDRPRDVPQGERSVVVTSSQTASWCVDPTVLLDRHPEPLDVQRIRETLGGRCVLITGAGGSIGSELARMACRFRLSKLVLVERSENALFEIDHEIAGAFPNVTKVAILHDVTDVPRTLALIQNEKPHAIFHAAAHKHVPMMEDHPAQAVENNFYGTRSIADAAHEAGVERFVMISTDKAVNPRSVMGATKRLAELYIQHLNTRSACVYSMVRFGNVLGSACSVLPIWGKQLARGGPITVTDPQMYRYFMTIPEAAGLVIQSGTFSKGGEVFVLDMGKPIRVLDLAQRFLRSHGLEPNVDVPIRITGARPGEKLMEELAYKGEDMNPTPHRSVRNWRTPSPDPARIEAIVSTFDRLRIKGDGRPWQHANSASIVAALRGAIPEMLQSAAG